MPATTQATPKEAQRACDHLIQMVKNVKDDGCECFGEFLGEFEPAAGRLINALRDLNQPLGHRLEWFRDVFLPDDTSARPFTELGLPLERDDCGRPYANVAHCGTWLNHMGDLRDSLTNIKPTRSRKPGAGRPKDDATVKLGREVQDVYTEARKLLTKGGMARPDVCARLKALSAAAILHRINENNNHPYPLHGPESRNIKRQVRRSSAWRALHEAEWPARSEEEQADRVVKDRQWALETGLPAGQN